MEKGWTYGIIYLFIQIHLVWGLFKVTFDGKKVFYASPGMDVDLICLTQKRASLVQTQWSKITNSTEMIALYHPQHGYHCNARVACSSLVTFTEMSPELSEWTLHLRNVSAAANGKYECSFTLFPDGICTKVLNFLVQTEVAQEERGGNYTAEVLFNHTLEIPCFPNISSVVSSGITFGWLMEENGIQETLIQNDTFPKNRIILRKDHGIYLSPIEILDNDRKFSCHVTIQSGKILKNVTRIKVFAKPDISMDMQSNSTDILEELTALDVTTSGIDIITGKRKSDEGFYELTSMLRMLKPNQPIVPNNLTIWCMTLFPVPGNEVWNISSRKITFSFGYVNTPTDSSSFTESTFSAFTSSLSSTGTTAGYRNTPTHPSNITASDISITTPFLSSTDTAADQFNSSTITQSYPDHSKKEIKPTDLWASTLTYNSTPSKASTTLNGTVPNKPEGGMSWPVIVASLLFICLFLFGLGIRKWCQYLKEIMERPPPFKPPPPPIKYTCIGEAVGGDLPCHEMETL
ncbi:T-cell surface protein tactile [Gracilinanus agilis]|uniref:T-cell surface protein tactile n=1 Tax=Gracilinanus agilis TaxID=191870 RepID=UPI001CFE9A64|nr:T-cell surface protein tactile [Gracilinanus agilis]